MSSNESLPTVYIVDDDPHARVLIEKLVQSADYPTRCFESAESFVQAAASGGPRGCLLLDLRMPGMDGMSLHKQLQADGHALPTILITAHADVPSAIEAIRAGVLDFVEKPLDAKHLLKAVRRAMDMDRTAATEAAEAAEAQRRLDQLSQRQRQVLDLIVEGLLNKQIAARLGLSIKTVEKHRAFVMQKMKVDSVAELVRLTMAPRHHRP
ncbi:MAG: response regulator [Phycisphaeraceae bacterium]|nr:response regulator [Phycisphaeraceae bacterium]